MSVHFGRNASHQRNSLKVDVMPAPTTGIDARAPTGNMPADVCIYTYNLMPAEYGMLLRPGFREHCIDLETTSSNGVFSLIGFTGVEPGAVDDRLFAITNEGIWDVTNENAPVSKLTFGVSSFGSGHGVSAHYVDQGGSDFLYYADGVNGLFIYDGDTDVWAAADPADITGPNLGAVVFVMVHKQRMWLVEEGKSSAWYLPIASGQGAATEFLFGGKFPHGGRVYAMYNWTLDSGTGVDDLLVVVSSSGDVVVYQGEDPSSATDWRITGTYYIGDIPAGRRIGSEYSGDLYLLSSFGLISMGDLIRGVDTNNPSSESLSFRVARPLRQQIAAKNTELGWEPKFIPPLGTMIVTVPQVLSESWIQYVLNLSTEGWGLWRGVPAQCVEDYRGKIYFGTRDNKVYVMDTTRDFVTIADPSPEENGIPVEFSILSSSQSLSAPGLYKQVVLVRPDFYGPSFPTYNTKVLYDYNFDEPDAPSSAPVSVQGDLWDDGLWDLAVWATSQGLGKAQLEGTSGIGRTVCIAMRGESGDDLRLISWDIMWKVGGPT